MKSVIRCFVSAFCIAAMLLSISVSVIAANDGLAFDMDALGITSGMRAGQRGDEYVRRDEFAQMVVCMIMQQDVAKTMENEEYFADVFESQYKGAVNLLTKMGYVSGDGNGNFNPSDYISYGAACKILVYALGYNPIVKENTLLGYISVAGNIGITKNIDSGDEYLTFSKVMKMIDNALDIGLMVPVYYNENISPSYEVDETKTFRNYLNGRLGDGVVKLTGVVTADKSTYLYNAVPNLKDTQIAVEGKVYNYNGKAPGGYVGQTVNYYVTTTDYEEGVIIALSPASKNTVYDFSGSQIEKISKTEIKFADDEIGKCTVNTDYETRYIYNNRIDLKFNPAEIKKNNSFVIRTVDNDNDGVAEVVFVYEYVDCIVEATYEETGIVTLKSGYYYGESKNILLDSDKMSFEIFDAKGKTLEFSDIKPDDVISVAQSKDGSMIRVITGLEPIRGTIVSLDGDYIEIDSTEYFCDKRVLDSKINPGTVIKGYVNFINTLVDYEEEKTVSTYGYVYSYGRSSGSSLGGYSVKMLMPEYISVKQVEGEVDELSGEADVSNSLFVRNKGVIILQTENKVTLDGKKVKAEQALEAVLDSPVAYTVGSTGKISKIDTLKGVDDISIKADDNSKLCVSLNNKKYNGTEQIFGGGNGNPFAIKGNYTLAFCVPLYKEQNKSTVSDDDLLVYAELLNGVGYEANGYEQDDDTFVADVLVVQKSMNSDQTIDVTGTSEVGLVTKISAVLDENEGTELISVTMLTDGGEKKFTVAEQRMNQNSLKRLETGDLAAYTLDGFDKLNTISILQKNDDYIDFDESEIGKVCAVVKDIKYNHISNGKIRWVNILEIGNGTDINYKYELLIKNPAPVFVIEDKSYRLGNFNDIQIGDRVAVVQDVETYNVRAIVINR